MRIGLDFDNTLACYDDVFYAVAAERGWVDLEKPLTKHQVRQYLRERNQAAVWTTLQGIVYGPEILRAEAFPGLHASLASIAAAGHILEIVSHKTRHPVIGPAHDLHAWAWRWLEQARLLAPLGPIDRKRVFFCETRGKKLDTIEGRHLELFVDDLPEVFADPRFPAATRKVLFDPHRQHGEVPGCHRLGCWSEFGACLNR